MILVASRTRFGSAKTGRAGKGVPHAHLVEGSLFQVQGVYRRTTLTRGRVLEESRIVALVFILYNMY